MGFRFHKRINLGNGHGINLSRSGPSYSKRTAWGSVGNRGFSVRTGIPGLRFYQPWGSKRRGKKAGNEMLIAFLIIILITALFQILVWIFKVLFITGSFLVHRLQQTIRK